MKRWTDADIAQAVVLRLDLTTAEDEQVKSLMRRMRDDLRMQVRSALEALEVEAFENETGMLANYWQWKELKRLVSADD